jgi:CrcB protein
MTHEHPHRDELRRVETEIARLPVDPDVEVSPRPLPHPGTLVRANADLLPVIAAGGALGALARWGLSEALPHGPSDFPWATFGENVTGAFLLGLLMALVLDVLAHTRYVRPFLGVGLLGGYTTFSTYMVDARGLLASGHPGTAFAYVGLTLVLGLLATFVGLAGGRWSIDRRRTREEVLR